MEYNKVQKKARELTAEEKEVSKMIEKHNFSLKQIEIEENQKLKEQEEKDAQNEAFWKKLGESEDPFDNLGDFAEYLHKNIGSTGVYIGQLEPPFKEIPEDADDEAHLDKSKPDIIKFKFANEDHTNLIVGTHLEPSEGITH